MRIVWPGSADADRHDCRWIGVANLEGLLSKGFDFQSASEGSGPSSNDLARISILTEIRSP